MDNNQKGRRVLQRLGVPGSAVEIMTAGEVDQLAAIYDTHVEPAERLPQVFGQFWAAHTARLDEQKATTDELPEVLTTEELTTEGTEEGPGAGGQGPEEPAPAAE